MKPEKEIKKSEDKLKSENNDEEEESENKKKRKAINWIKKVDIRLG